jgi:diacylglycerol kinase (ATP)
LWESSQLVLAGASTGFPPQAIHEAETVIGLTGRARYERALVDLAASFVPYPGRVVVDGIVVHKGLTMLANIGGSRYRGGQFEVLPHSVVDDGLLDVCVIGGEHDPAEMLTLARKGKHVTRPGVVYARGRIVIVERMDSEPLWFEHDGEVLRNAGSRFTLTVVPQAVPLFVGAAVDHGRRLAA